MRAQRQRLWSYAEIFGKDHYLSRASGPRPARAAEGATSGSCGISRGDGAAACRRRTTRTICGRRTPKTQDVLMCIQMGKTVDDTNRLRFETQEFYIKSEEEMRELFSDVSRRQSKTRRKSPNAATSSSRSANTTCRNSSSRRATTALTYLKELCDKGFDERYGDAQPEYRAADGLRD